LQATRARHARAAKIMIMTFFMNDLHGLIR
jgi:hypothetical protein